MCDLSWRSACKEGVHMKVRNKQMVWWLLATAAWMAFIFYKSSQTYADQDLRPTLAAWLPLPILEQWLPHIEFTYDGGLVTWKQPYDFVEFFIRKGAHVTEYAILAFLVIRTLLALRWERWMAIVIGAVISVAYAASDEWHQSFVPNRTGHAIDVAVDSIGVVLVVLLFLIAGLFSRSKGKERGLHFP
ncbi:conserved membrane protein of unknown function [Paenibacillus alvei]|uniref:VanZ-like domain-containing protein n=2 Tax=Paenibacillus alvei TaxID=44250 RepID=A0A383RHV6_PAEAL|nr:conserved membrane protein of unknown function [Paenibacillus alvei]